MSRPRCLLVSFLALLSAPANTLLQAQQPPGASSKPIAIRAGHLIDGKADAPVSNVLIVVEDGKIASVTPGGVAPISRSFTNH